MIGKLLSRAFIFWLNAFMQIPDKGSQKTKAYRDNTYSFSSNSLYGTSSWNHFVTDVY